MKEELVSRDFVAEDAKQLTQVHAATWGYECPKDYWTWKYNDAPDGAIGFVVTNPEGRIVSFAGFWKREILIEGKGHPILTLCDVMTHPEYRGQAAFSILLNRMRYEVLHKTFFFGFSNEVSHTVLGNYFADTNPVDSSVPIYTLPVNPARFIKRLQPINRLLGRFSRLIYIGIAAWGRHKTVVLEGIDQFSEEFETFWLEVALQYRTVLKRDLAYLTWRYINDPYLNYKVVKAVENGRLVGWMVFHLSEKGGGKVGRIMDWLVPSDRMDVFREMIRGGIEMFLKDGVDQIDIWVMSNASDWAACLKPYFARQRKKRPYLFGGGPVWFTDEYKDLRQRLRTEGVEYFNLGDSDFMGG